MSKKYIYILGVCLGILVSACTKEPALDTTIVSGSISNGSDGLDISLAFPEMKSMDTRAIDDGTNPDLEKLDIFLFVFDGSQLLQSIHFIPLEETKVEDGVIKFKAYLPQTDNNAIIHIVAIDDSAGTFAEQIDNVGYGLEDTVMPALSVSNNQDAYWQRIELGCRILVSVEGNDDDQQLDNLTGTEDTIRGLFAHPIPLVRNFAKITLSATEGLLAQKSSDGTPVFEIIGWTVVNYLDRGSVVPWFFKPGSSDVEFPEYIDITNEKEYLYEDITAQGFYGVSQAGAELVNYYENLDEESGSMVGALWGTGDKYIYERKTVSVNPLFILLYAKFDGNPGYYKIALGYTNPETGLFTDYNVLRNIEYNIKIKAVTAKGASSPAEAANGPASNNVSGDVTTRNLTQISDGVDMLYVNWVNQVVTEKGKTIDFQFRYLTHITGTKTQRNDLVFYDTPNIGIVTGDVVESYELEENVADKFGDLWHILHIKTKDPSNDVKQQSFIVYSEPGNNSDETIGLSRKINLVLRNKWDFIRMETFPGLWNDDRAWPEYDPDEVPTDDDINYYVGAQKGAPLTVFWELPAGLPEAVFPLDFTLESNRQNIENASVGNAVVQSGSSLFEGVNDNRISFVKTVTWQDYAPNGESSTAASRIIRARFVTTTNIASLFDDSYISTIKLHNSYFNDIEDKFQRGKPSSDSKMPADLIWDFSTNGWPAIFAEAIGDSGKQNVIINRNDGLEITQGATGTNTTNVNQRMKWGTDDNGTYIATRGANDKFVITENIPKQTVALLKITAAADNPNSSTQVNISESHTPTSVTFIPSDSDVFTTIRTRTYQIIVQDATKLTVTLKPGASYSTNNAVRIYKIEFYPTGEPQAENSTGN